MANTPGPRIMLQAAGATRITSADRDILTPMGGRSVLDLESTPEH
jgi:hypothetical protein